MHKYAEEDITYAQFSPRLSVFNYYRFPFDNNSLLVSDP